MRCFRGRAAAALNAKRMMRSTPTRVKMATSVAVSHGWPTWLRPPWPAYSPSELSRTSSQSIAMGRPEHASRRWDYVPGKCARPDVGVELQRPTQRQQQAPQGDVVWDVR